MSVNRVTREQATAILNSYGLTLVVWASVSIENGTHQAIVADYTQLPAYKVAYAISIYDLKTDRMVERFNIMR